MGVLFFDGFEHDDLATRWSLSYNERMVYSTETRYGGGRALAGSIAFDMTKHTSPIETICLGMAVRTTVGSPVETDLAAFSAVGGSGPATVLSLQNGSFRLRRRISTAAQYTIAVTDNFQTGAWNYLELRLKARVTGGIAELRVNGETVIDYVGSTSDQGDFDTTTITTKIQGGESIYIDDYYIADDGFLGEVRVKGLKATGAGDASDFTPSGLATNWENAATLGDGNYNASSTDGDRDLYQAGDILPTDQVLAVEHIVTARKSDVLAPSIRHALKSNGTVYTSPTLRTPTPSFASTVEMHSVNPVTSLPWTASDVNALQIGVEVDEP